MSPQTKAAAPKRTAAVPTEPPPSASIMVNRSGPAEVPDPERALLSCLLRLDAAGAIAVAELVPTEWLASPALAELLAAVSSLAHVGIDPEPNAVLNLLRSDGRANGERAALVALLLASLYESAAVPASARFYAAAVLREATRRRAREASERLDQAAETVPIDALPALIEDELTAVQLRAEWSVRVGRP